MPDPIRALESFESTTTDVVPLPAAEVRQRGERRRRRTQVLVATGAVAAMAVLAGGGVVVADSLRAGDRVVPPATSTNDPTPSPTVVASAKHSPTAIPDGFELAAGLRDVTVTETAAMSALDYCGVTPLADLVPVDVRTAALHGGETAITRTLYLLPDAAAADAAHDAVVDAARTCASAPARAESRDRGDVVVHPETEAWPGTAVTEDFAYGASTAEPAVEVVHVVRRGSAFLVTSAYGSWSGDVAVAAEQIGAELRPVVEAMDALAGDG